MCAVNVLNALFWYHTPISNSLRKVSCERENTGKVCGVVLR